MATFIFPTSGNALTAIKSSVLDPDASLPPPRKALKIAASSSVRTPRDPDRKRTFRIVTNTTTDPTRPVLQTIRQHVELSIREILRVDNQIINGFPKTTYSFESIFDDCRSTIILGHEGDYLTRVTETALNKAAQDVLAILKKNDGYSAEWLAECLGTWDWWLNRLTILKSVLVFLDTEYLSPKGAQSIWSMGINIFSARILNDHHITSHLQAAIHDWLASEHESGISYTNDQRRALIKRLVALVDQLNTYHEHFVQPYLEWVATYYAEQLTNLDDPSHHSPTAIMNLCLQYLEEETVRAVTLLHPESVHPVEQTILSHYIAPMQGWLAEAGVKETSDARSIDELYQLFLLFKKTTTSLATYALAYPTTRPALEVLRNALIEDAASRVRVIVTTPNSEGDAQMVESLLSLRDFYEAFLKKGVEERTWVDAINDAFAKGFSARKNKPAEMIAKSLDTAMRKGQKNATDEEFFVYLRRVLMLYRFSTDRDVFRTFYTRGLAKRLLLGRSASEDFEQRVIKTLTDEYDDSFGDLRPMFKDIALSKDLTAEYHRRRANERPDLSVIVLQESVWPIVKKVSTADRKGKGKVGAGPKTIVETELRLPEKMELTLRDYSKFYSTKHGNRVLSWAHYLGTATLISHFPKGNKELSVSLYQATVLLLFNEKTSWKAEEIQEATGFNNNDLTLTLQSLALGKKRVLAKKGSAGKAVEKEDLFTFNNEFMDVKYKVHVNSIQRNESAEEAQHAAQVIDFSREASLDAAIVRIMKAKKTLRNTELINLTIDAVKKHFTPQPADIKARLESLMERDFVKRKEGNVRTWEYVA